MKDEGSREGERRDGTDPAGAPELGVSFAMAARARRVAAESPPWVRHWRSCKRTRRRKTRESELGGAAPKVCSQTRRKLAKSKPSKNDVPANPCILRHHRTFALVLDKVQSNEGLPGAKFTARSSPRSRFKPAVRTPGGPVARHPQLWGRKPALRREIRSILRGFQGRLSC